MRILVTGIDGFVGSHTAEFLLQQKGVEVHGTVIEGIPRPNIAAIESSLHLHPIDLLAPSDVVSVIRKIKPDRIIHLAGQAFVPTSVRDPIGTFQVNILGGVAILEAARQLQESGASPSVLMVSTGEVYGRVESDKMPIAEDYPLQPANPYASSKASIDLISQQYRKSFGIDVVVARPFNHAGARQSPVFVCSDFAKQVAEITSGKRKPEMFVGDIESSRDFTDVRDVVQAYWQILEHPGDEGVFNICSGRPVKIKTVLDNLFKLAGVDIEVVVEKHRLRPYDVPVVFGSATRLQSATGWKPAISLEQTISDLFEYWKRQVSAS